MKTIYEYVNVSASVRLEEIVENKLAPLFIKYPSLVRAQVFFKLENSNSEENKHCGIKLSVPGPIIYASSNEESFEKAILKVSKDLNKLLEKRKDSFNSYVKTA